MSKCVFAGIFNPFTIGHQAIVDKCLQLFDEVIICFAVNPDKAPKSSDLLDSMKTVEDLYRYNARVSVEYWDGAIVDFLAQKDTNIYVRGIRNSIDLDYENSQYYINRELYPQIIEVYIPCDRELLHISSSTVRWLKKLHKPYEKYLPKTKHNS